MSNQDIHVVAYDPIDEQIEILAALTDAWQRQNDKGKNSPILRRKIIYEARNLWDEFAIYELEE